MTAVIRAARRLVKPPKLGAKVRAKARAKLNRATGKTQLRASLRKVKKRWNIPGRIRDQVEEIFIDLFGQSPRGTSWSALAERYPERFKEYIDEAQAQAAEELEE